MDNHTTDTLLRTCTKCQRTFPLSKEYFHHDKSRVGGFTKHCKECRGGIFGNRYPIAIQSNHKICARCKQEKPLTEFHKHKYSRDGYGSYCKICRQKEYRRTPEQLAENKIKRHEKISGANNIWYGKKRPPEFGQKVSLSNKLRRASMSVIPGLAGLNRLYGRYRKSAHDRGLDFNITKEQFQKLTQQNCYYCGIAPFRIEIARDARGNYQYNGLDRVDNSKGYIEENLVPCCLQCNQAKLNYSQEEFFEWALRVVDTYRSRNK